MIKTDIIIIGAGPVGLFTVFEAGLLKLRCHLIDSLAQPGGQLSEVYPKKPIYDIPGYPVILAEELKTKLMEQIEVFKPTFTLGETALTIDKQDDESFIVVTDKGTVHHAPVVIIAGGLGVFEPRKPPIPNIEYYEDKGVEYMIKDPEKLRDKRVVIAGGGDSALDWVVYLAENKITKEISLVHRRSSFSGSLDFTQKIINMHEQGIINLITDAEVRAIEGERNIEHLIIKHKAYGEIIKQTDYFLPLFGFKPSLGPVKDWGLEIERRGIKVNTRDYSTNIKGIFAVGDINYYEGKLKLILCGFHEGTMAVQSAFEIINPQKRNVLQYTTVTGVNAF